MSAYPTPEPTPAITLDPVASPIHPRWSHGWSTAFSVLLIVLGIVAVSLPNVSGLALTLYFGWLLALGGVVLLFFALRSHSATIRWFQILLGVVYLLIGGFLILHPLAGLATLTVLLAAYLFFEGALELLVALRAQPRAGRTWLLFDAAIAFVIAIAILAAWPNSSAWAIGTLVGINMIFSGLSRLMVTGAVRRHTLLPSFQS